MARLPKQPQIDQDESEDTPSLLAARIQIQVAIGLLRHPDVWLDEDLQLEVARRLQAADMVIEASGIEIERCFRKMLER